MIWTPPFHECTQILRKRVARRAVPQLDFGGLTGCQGFGHGHVCELSITNIQDIGYIFSGNLRAVDILDLKFR